MKYMHFKASCSYAALAAIMEIIGVDTEDYKIALEIKLPWLFSKEDGAYISGPMLQGAKWFNLWLLPRGYRIVEKAVNNAQLSEYLPTTYVFYARNTGGSTAGSAFHGQLA